MTIRSCGRPVARLRSTYQSEPPCDVDAGRVTEAATWQQTAAHSGVLLYWKSVHCNWKMTHCIDHVPETSILVIRSQQPGRRIWATDRWLLIIRDWRVTRICKLVVTNVTERSDKEEWKVEICGRNLHMMNWKLQPQNFTINWLLYRSVDGIIILQYTRFQTFAVIWILYIFFWVFPRRQIVVGRRFGTLCQFDLQRLDVDSLTVYIQPLKMELTQGSETSANYNLTPGKYPKEYIQY